MPTFLLLFETLILIIDKDQTTYIQVIAKPLGVYRQRRQQHNITQTLFDPYSLYLVTTAMFNAHISFVHNTLWNIYTIFGKNLLNSFREHNFLK